MKSIVWISIESLRYDRVFDADCTSRISFGLQTLAENPKTASFKKCFSHGNWTRTATTSMLSGMYPSSHGVFHWTDKLSKDAITVPELLSKSGYDTLFVGKNSQISSAIDAEYRFDETVIINRNNVREAVGIPGVLKYLLRLRSHGGGLTTDFSRHKSSYLTNEAIKLRVNAENEPVFLFVHFNDTHNPYIPPLPYLKDAVESLSVSADEAISIAKDLYGKDRRKYEVLGQDRDFTDTEIEVITSFYKASTNYVEKMVVSVVEYLTNELDAIVVVTGDHGELFGEEGLISHVITTHNAVTHVPLLVHGKTALREYSGQIQHIDVIKTLLNEQGIDHSNLQGFDLRTQSREYSIVERGEERSNANFRRIESVQGKEAIAGYHEGHLTALQTDEFKYLTSDSGESLFKLPDESQDVQDKFPDVLEAFSSRYIDYVNTYGGEKTASEKSALDDKRKQHLENMGYLVD